MMNIALNPRQEGTRHGDLALVGNVDFTGLENRLAKIGSNAGVPNLYLPATTDDFSLYIVMSGDIATANTAVQVPDTGDNCNLFAYGTGSAGDILILADPTANAGAQAGMVRSLVGNHAPATPGRYFRAAIAEEDFADGQYVKARWMPGEVRIVSPQNTLAGNAGGVAAAPVAGTRTIATIIAGSAANNADLQTTQNAFADIVAELNLVKAILEAQGLVA